MINLEKFCDKSNDRIRHPWRVPCFIYATDGEILIRVNSDVKVSGKVIDETNWQPTTMCENILAPINNIETWKEIDEADKIDNRIASLLNPKIYIAGQNIYFKFDGGIGVTILTK